MGVAVGGWVRLGAGFFERPACFWGLHAAGFNLALILGVTALGFLIGMFVGLVIGGLFPDPEPVSHAVIAAAAGGLAAKIGALIGALLSVGVVIASRCSPCGFCFCIVAFISPWGFPRFPFPVAVRPCTGQCALLVPPGCP
jgi:hypothetical protein